MTNDFIVRYQSVLSRDECEDVIGHINFLKENSILVGNDRRNSHVCDYESYNFLQDHDHLYLVSSTKVANRIMHYMAPCVEEYLKTFSVLSDMRFLLNDVKLKRIPKGAGFHKWHFENATIGTSQRYFVVQLYLNDDFEGGETEFLYLNRREKAVAGDVLIYPTGYTHTHRGNPPIGGDKYMASSWGWIQP